MRQRLAHMVESASVWMLAGLLVMLPFWRHRVLLHRLGDPIFFEFQDITLYTSDLLWLAAIGGWILSRLLYPVAPPLRLGPWFLSGPLAGLVALGIVGIPFSIDPTFAGYQVVRLLMLALLYLMVVNVPMTPGTVAWPLSAGMVIQMAIALPQFALGRSLGLRRLGEVNVQAAWSGASVVMAGEQRWLRAYGLAQHPNLLAGCLMVMLLLVTGYYLTESRWQRLLLLFALAAGLVTLLATFSRAAWLGAAVGGVTMLGLVFWSRRQGRWSPETSSLALLAALLLATGAVFTAANWQLLRPRLGLTSQGVEIRSVEARAMQVEAAWTLIGMRPALGVGIGNYPQALYRLAREKVAAYPVFQPVHNVFLLSAAELGLPGGAIWLIVMAAPWAALWLRRREVQMTPWWAGIGGALAALTVVSFFDYYPWESHQGRLVLILVWGLWAREWTRGDGLERIR